MIIYRGFDKYHTVFALFCKINTEFLILTISTPRFKKACNVNSSYFLLNSLTEWHVADRKKTPVIFSSVSSPKRMAGLAASYFYLLDHYSYLRQPSSSSNNPALPPSAPASSDELARTRWRPWWSGWRISSLKIYEVSCRRS
jgi:hypothetical protein